MATLSTVAVDFIANTAKYLQGLTQMANANKKFANDTSKEFSKGSKGSTDFTNSLGGILKGFNALKTAAGGGIIIGFLKELTNTAGQLTDLSDELGVNTEKLQRFQSLFASSGVKLEEVRTLFVKLSKSAQDAAGGNEELNGAFEKLGISVNTFKNLNPEQQVQKLSVALQGIESPAERAAIAQQLLGKSSGKLLSSLKELAEKGSIEKATQGLIVSTDEATRNVDRFTDDLQKGWTSATSAALRFLGTIVKIIDKLDEVSPKATEFNKANAFFGQGGLGTANVLQNATKDLQEYGKTELQQAREEQRLIRQRVEDQLALQEAQRKRNVAFLAGVNVEKDSVDALSVASAKYETDLQKLRAEAEKQRVSVEVREVAERNLLAAFAKQTAEIVANENAIRSRTSTLLEQSRLINTQTQSQQSKIADNALEFSSQFEATSTDIRKSVMKTQDEILSGAKTPFFSIDVSQLKSDAQTATFITDKLTLDRLAAGEAEANARQKTLEESKKITEELIKSGLTAEQVYAQRTTAINTYVADLQKQGRSEEALRIQTLGLAEAQKDFEESTSKAFEKANPQIFQAFELMSNFADQFSRAIVQGENFGDALKGVFQSILRDIAALLIRTLILQAIMASLGFVGATNAAKGFGQLTGLIPKGGMADGGPVMAGQPYRVGERGAETFVPMTNGMILPNDFQGGGEQVNVYQTINIQTGVAQTVRAEMLSLLPRFKSEAVAGVIEGRARGGSLSRAITA